MKRVRHIKTETYKTENGFYVDIATNNKTKEWEAYIYCPQGYPKDNIGKFGKETGHSTIEEVICFVEKNLDETIADYVERYIHL